MFCCGCVALVLISESVTPILCFVGISTAAQTGLGTGISLDGLQSHALPINSMWHLRQSDDGLWDTDLAYGSQSTDQPLSALCFVQEYFQVRKVSCLWIRSSAFFYCVLLFLRIWRGLRASEKCPSKRCPCVLGWCDHWCSPLFPPLTGKAPATGMCLKSLRNDH